MSDLSKIKLGETTYNLKDAQARADMTTLLGSHNLAALGAAAWKGVVTAVAAESADLPTSAAVKDYVDSMIETIPEFDVVVVPQGETKPTASADTFHKIYLEPATSPASPNLYIEWITIRSGSEGAYTYSWEKIGDTAMDLSGYVQKTQLIAGIDLQDNITAAELKSALDLGNLAYANTATGEVAGQTISGLKAAGNVDLELEGALGYASTAASLTTADYTPAGSITGAAISGGSISVSVKDAGTATAATITRGDYTPSGDVAVTLKNANVVASVDTAGTVPSFTEGAFTPNTPTALDLTKFNGGSAATWTGASHTAASLGNATKAQFAQEGLVGEVGTGNDAETLILTAATKANAVTEQGTFTPDTVDFGTFNGGSAASLAEGFYSAGSAASKAADSFNAGAMPTFSTGTVAVDSASFTGDTAENLKVTGVNYLKQEIDTASFTPVAATLGFSGTTATGALVTGVNYDKANIGTVDVKAADISLDVDNVVVSAKNVTVSPDAKA